MSYSVRPATIADIPHIVRHRELMFREMNIQALFEEMAAAMESWLRHVIPSRTYQGWMAVTDGGDVVGVSARHTVDAEARLYDRLFSVEDPDGAASKQDVDFTTFINPGLPGRSTSSPPRHFWAGATDVNPDSSRGRPTFRCRCVRFRFVGRPPPDYHGRGVPRFG